MFRITACYTLQWLLQQFVFRVNGKGDITDFADFDNDSPFLSPQNQ